MYDALTDFLSRPTPFSAITTAALWTDPHIAGEMLRFHLDGSSDLASRRTESIDALTGWIDRRFQLDGKAVTDLGCGPGLYAERYSRRGAKVTGLDFSASSLAHARKAAEMAALAIDYRQANYIEADYPPAQDIITLIYGDFCAMAPDSRRRVLDKARQALNPDGVLVFDVFSTGMLADIREETTFGRRLMGGFWAAGDYVGFKSTFVYPDESIGLDRYLIVTPDRRFEIFNWMQYYTPASITAEVLAAGYSAVEIVDVETGGQWRGGATAFVVIAQP